MSQLGQAATFAYGLYRVRAELAYAGYLKRDPMARLGLRPGRTNPYEIYDRLRAAGTLVPTRLGNWSTTSHRVCNACCGTGASASGRPPWCRPPTTSSTCRSWP